MSDQVGNQNVGFLMLRLKWEVTKFIKKGNLITSLKLPPFAKLVTSLYELFSILEKSVFYYFDYMYYKQDFLGMDFVFR